MKTLEEAAENYGWRIKTNTFTDRVKANELANSAKQDFIAGAKWQAERMYSEEEVLDLLNKREDYINSEDNIFDYQSTNQWFEQFKKK